MDFNNNKYVGLLETTILRMLIEEYVEREHCCNLNYFATRLGISREYVRVCLRLLTDRGLAVYERVLMDEDGLLRGSGYQASQKAIDEYGAPLLN